MILLRSVRWRLTLWYAAVMAAALLAFAGWMWWSVRQYLAVSADTRIASRLQGLRTAIETEADESVNALKEELHEFAVEMPEGELTAVRGRGGRDLLQPAGIAEPVLWSAPEQRIGDMHIGAIRYRAFRTRIVVKGEMYDLAVATSTLEADQFLAQFRWLLIAAAPILVLIASGGGYWMSRRALAPVDRLTTAARRISVDNLSQRLAIEPTGDELERLGITWNEMIGRLDDAVQRIRQFTADASHELRTPIAVIRTSAELALRRERDPAEYRRALENIHRESEWMTHLAEDLLLLARADSGTLMLRTQPLDVNAVVRGAADQAAPIAEVRRIRINTRFVGGDVVVNGDERALHRVMTVLVENALQHTPPEGTIQIMTSTAEDVVMIEVQNSGDGVRPEDLPHIFERFYRGDPARTRQNGAGVGLAIARSITEAHGGQIEVESTPGEGAQFRVRLPLIGGRGRATVR